MKVYELWNQIGCWYFLGTRQPTWIPNTTQEHGTSDLITNGAYIHTHITHIRNIKRGRGTGGNRGQAKKGVGLLSMTLEFWVLILLLRGHAGSAFKDILSKKDLYSKWGFIFVTFPRSWKLFRLLYIRQNDYSFCTFVNGSTVWLLPLQVFCNSTGLQRQVSFTCRASMTRTSRLSETAVELQSSVTLWITSDTSHLLLRMGV